MWVYGRECLGRLFTHGCLCHATCVLPLSMALSKRLCKFSHTSSRIAYELGYMTCVRVVYGVARDV
jgi:hypothetical protein